MNVQSLAFLAFLTVTVCACRLLGQKRQVWALLAASLVFYLWNGAAGVWWSCGLLAASSAVSLLAGNSCGGSAAGACFWPPFAIMSRCWEFSSTPAFSPAAQCRRRLCRWASAFSPFSRSGICMRYTPARFLTRLLRRNT